MDYKQSIEKFIPGNEQEAVDKKVILSLINEKSDKILSRSCEIAHITSSGFIMNKSLDKVLLVHHNIRNTWAWTGGHADGEKDLLEVAMEEAKEETGILDVKPLCNEIASLDILTMFGHMKNGNYVNAHLHLSVAYILICNENDMTTIKPDENSDIAWFNTDIFTTDKFDSFDAYLYNKLVVKAKTL